MRAKLLSAVCVAAAMLAAPALAALPPPQPLPWIVVPLPPLPPAPPPRPVDPVVQLAADELYVIESRDPCFFMLSPAANLDVMQAAGPFTAFAKFYNGGGKAELKTFAGPTVLVVRASGQGRSTLTVVKVGAQTPADVFTQTFDTGPPAPPPPPPPPPPPLDPLTASLQAAYNLDFSPTKGDAVKRLAAIYRQSVVIANNPAQLTVGSLYGVVSPVVKAAVPAGTLAALCKVIGTEFDAKLPTDPTAPLTPELRAVCSQQFSRMAEALEAIR